MFICVLTAEYFHNIFSTQYGVQGKVTSVQACGKLTRFYRYLNA